jgi:ATP phosphoribosyltransferase
MTTDKETVITTTATTTNSTDDILRFAIPKGRMNDNVMKLLADAGIRIQASDRGYRPTINLPNIDLKLLKPQNIVEMLHSGSRDLGFAGADWVENLGATNCVSVLNTNLDPVRVVAAAPSVTIFEDSKKSNKTLVVASEYEKLTKDFIERRGINAKFVRAFGATESFPPEDADFIVDNCATGSTLRANNLHIVDEVFSSCTHLFANAEALKNPVKKAMIDRIVMLLESVLVARSKTMVAFNVPSRTDLDHILPFLPSMRAPTINALHNEAGFAVSVCVDRKIIPSLLPQLKENGALDIIITRADQIIM